MHGEKVAKIQVLMYCFTLLNVTSGEHGSRIQKNGLTIIE